MAKYMRDRYERDAEWVRQYKVEKGCLDCGYDAHHAGLQFDHREPRAKTGDPVISSVMSKGLNRIKLEIAKCDVVCGTCHGIRTWTRKQQEKQDASVAQLVVATPS